MQKIRVKDASNKLITVRANIQSLRDCGFAVGRLFMIRQNVR